MIIFNAAYFVLKRHYDSLKTDEERGCFVWYVIILLVILLAVVYFFYPGKLI